MLYNFIYTLVTAVVKTDAEKKETKHASLLLLRLVYFFLQQSLNGNNAEVLGYAF